MPRAAKRDAETKEEHTHLSISVESYEAGTAASINHNIHSAQYAWNINEEDPVYEFTNHVKFIGSVTYPPTRAGDRVELRVYGDDSPSRHLNTTLKDIQARDKHGSPLYRTYRGRQVPVYIAPKGLGLLEKVRGEKSWTGWLFFSPRFVTDALSVLGRSGPVFIALHERKVERVRWIQRVSLQTTDPSLE